MTQLISKMVCEAHIIAWNESETIHLTIKHYQQFCSRIILYDNYSDDGTPEIAKSMGCEVINFGIKGVLDDREYTNLKNNCWKGSKADWVVVVDADELLVNKDFKAWFLYDLFKNKWIGGEATIFKTYGWNVYSHEAPRETFLEITTGFYDPSYSKLCIFNPREIREINYVHGCHVAKPEGNIKYSDETLVLFHYRNVGGPQRLIDRHELYRKRMSYWNIRWQAGVHYTYDDERRRKEWEEQYARSVNFSPDFIYGYERKTQASQQAG